MQNYKVTVIDEEGNFSIHKFPSGNTGREKALEFANKQKYAQISVS